MSEPAIDRTPLAPHLDTRRLVVGMWQVSGAHGAIDPERALRSMREHFDRGFTTFDLADHYGPAEDLIGEFRRRLRTEWVSDRELLKQVIADSSGSSPVETGFQDRSPPSREPRCG